MWRQKKAIGILFGLLLTLYGSVTAEAGQRPVLGSFSGGFVAGEDTNYDGIPSAEHTQLVVSTVGIFINEVVSEVLPALPVPVTCPANTLEFHFLYNQAAGTHFFTGDQLFGSYTSGTLCLNPATGRFSFKGTGVYTGGTGKFTGASGSFSASSNGRLLPDGSGNQTGIVTGTLILP